MFAPHVCVFRACQEHLIRAQVVSDIVGYGTGMRKSINYRGTKLIACTNSTPTSVCVCVCLCVCVCVCVCNTPNRRILFMASPTRPNTTRERECVCERERERGRERERQSERTTSKISSHEIYLARIKPHSSETHKCSIDIMFEILQKAKNCCKFQGKNIFKRQ